MLLHLVTSNHFHDRGFLHLLCRQCYTPCATVGPIGTARMTRQLRSHMRPNQKETALQESVRLCWFGSLLLTIFLFFGFFWFLRGGSCGFSIFMRSCLLCIELILLLPFQFGCFVFSFSYLIALSRTSSTTWITVGKSRHLCLTPDLGGKAFSLLSLNLLWDFHIWPLLC
jgi:hypothetical protein